MKNTALSFLLLASACGTEVDLRLDLAGDAPPRGGGRAPSIAMAGTSCESLEERVNSAFVALHDRDGQRTAVRSLGARPLVPGSDATPLTVAIGPEGQVAVGGYFVGAADFGAGQATPAPGVDSGAFLAVYGPTGSVD